MRLDELRPGMRLRGVVSGAPVTVLSVLLHGSSAATIVYRTVTGSLEESVVYAADQDRIVEEPAAGRAFDADTNDFKLAAEAQRIQMAGLFDPMLAVATSDVQPLPHQIQAVYGELLPRTPLRFLLADDPGAGKTIMAGLFIKELMLRDDVKHALIVAPGGLVEQWQDELETKFGVRFELLTNQMIDANYSRNVFEANPLLIARMDQLARNEDLQDKLAETEWDLIVVDEAHRMGAAYFGNRLNKTKRFLLGELLGSLTRHLLLMTATPHSGKEENFQLFLSLLDKDRFEGKHTTSVNTAGVMRRMVKEDLLTFEGRPLFPERIAVTVPYELTSAELALYDEVTRYVREGMNRADRLDGKRRNTVGFALTVLQRRLASSPEAILRSLERRADRLDRKRTAIAVGTWRDDLPDIDLTDLDDEDLSAEETERFEDTLLDAATASQSVEELQVELADLARLLGKARQVAVSGSDRKWTELSTILQDHAIPPDAHGRRRKLIVFTEHRDTLEYLQRRTAGLLGRPESVVAIHGGVRRADRRRITEEFTHNPEVQVLVATDAAGEGLNLQAAHLMVNYDLPWNPNRIEQRFGRVHRIGQEEVCRLWNLVADNTREGEVFTTLLGKLEQMRTTYGGKVFDVLGQAFDEVPLRQLLLDAIQYGDDPATKARMRAVIDQSVGDGLVELMNEQALAADHLADADLHRLRAAMDEARARRLQPHYIELAFREGFARLGGRMILREAGRFEIRNVPASLRTRANGAVATRYERVTFDLAHVHPDGKTRAELLAPGHPLHDAVMADAVARHRDALQAGTVLVSRAVTEPTLMVGVAEEITDGTGAYVGRRFGYAYVDQHGTVTDAGPAPYLDCVAAPASPVVDEAKALSWLADAEQSAVSWMITHRLPDYIAEVQPRRIAELERTRELVAKRLQAENERLLLEAAVAREKEDAGDKPRESSDSLTRKAADLDARLQARLARITQQLAMTGKPPRLLTAALVLPIDWFEDPGYDDMPTHARETETVERRAVDLVLSHERQLGRTPREMPHNNPGYDILSTAPDGHVYTIEVKGRTTGAKDFWITHREIQTGKNAPPLYRLALVAVDPRGPAHDQIRYIPAPFATTDLGSFATAGILGKWDPTWATGHDPF